MIQFSRVALFTFLAFLLLTSLGCGTPKQTADRPQPDEDGPPLIAQQFSVKAQTGGAVRLDLGDGSRAKIVFPQSCL